ncbi:hypothetical protein GGI42DRAFT_323233 [Trichoderma sp. SZMC 28013]
MLAMGLVVLLAKIPPKSRLHGFRGLGLPQRIDRRHPFHCRDCMLSEIIQCYLHKLYSILC